MKNKAALAEIERFEVVVRAFEAIREAPDTHEATDAAKAAWGAWMQVTQSKRGEPLGLLYEHGGTDLDMLIERLRICKGVATIPKTFTRMVRTMGASQIRQREAAAQQARRAEEKEEDPDSDAFKPERVPHLRLQKTQSGVPKPLANALNVHTVLSLDTRWKGRLEFNDFSGESELDRQPLTDTAVTRISAWLQKVYGFTIAKGALVDTIDMVAEDNHYHPVREYLRGLSWDGMPRVHRLLTDYMKAQTTSERHEALLEEVALRWMVSAVARVMQPGCQVKAALLLVGDQNAGKSSALRILGDPWYSRTRIELENKDGMVQLQGVWIYELPEIRGLFTAYKAESVKQFLDQEVDRYRTHFKTFPRPHPRQCVFGATDNTLKLLNDPTGSSRYYPVTVGRIDLERLADERDLLWAEAVRSYDAGERWHLHDPEAALLASISRGYQEIDPWTDKIADFMDEQRVQGILNTLPEILDGLKLDLRMQDMKVSHRVGGILRSLGYVTIRHRRESGKQVTVWKRLDDAPAEPRP